MCASRCHRFPPSPDDGGLAEYGARGHLADPMAATPQESRLSAAPGGCARLVAPPVWRGGLARVWRVSIGLLPKVQIAHERNQQRIACQGFFLILFAI